MRVDVEMRAFMGGTVRPVDVPAWELGPDPSVEMVLELAFKYGQNDFQPKPYCSVSVGDVILWQGARYEVAPVGFKRLDTPS